jgi:endonuclease I
MYSENQTEPILIIIQQGLHNDVVTILRKGLLQQRTYHSTIHFGSAAPMVSDAHFITPTDGKVNGQRSSYPHGTVVPLGFR